MNSASKSALVIGGTGFLGGGIVTELLAAGWSVTNLARGQKQSANVVALLQADRSKPGEMATAIGGREFDLVVDCAAFDAAHAADAVAAFAGHVGHYVFISTDFVYAATADARYPLREDAPKQTALPYGVNKLAAEAILKDAWESKRFPATTLRPPHILGVGKALGCEPLAMREMQLPKMIREGAPLQFLAEGQLLVQPVWNREVGRCIAQIAGNAKSFGGIFNCAGADAITALRYYQIVAEAIGAPLRWESVALDAFRERYPDKAHMARHRVYDMTSLYSATGYAPTLRVEDAIHETLDWVNTCSLK